jgi:flagellar biosynthesis/type III secretory pathway chaperone
MFLVLALTGQMRVLLETAPTELSELLNEWKEKSQESLESIQQARSQFQVMQQEQAQTMKRTLVEVSLGYVGEMKEVGMATTSAIAQANQETLKQASSAASEAARLKEEVAVLCSNVKREREIWANQMQVLMNQVSEPIENLKYANQLANLVKSEIQEFRSKAIWMQVFEWFTPLTALALATGAGFLCGLFVMLWKYNNDQNTLGRNLVEWNIDRILKCQQDKNKKCTIWIVTPPQKRN